MRRILLCVLLHAFAFVLCAEDLHIDTLRTKQLQEVSVDRPFESHHSQITTSTPLFVLSSEDFNSLGLQDIAQALKIANGVSVKDYGGMGGMKTVSVRNLGAEHTGVVYDGVPVSNCQAGQIDISRFSTDNLQSIRMGIGAPIDMLSPASIEPFSGNLLLQTDPQSPSYIKASYGSFNTVKATSKINAYNHNGYSLYSLLNYNHTDGDYPFTLSNGSLKTREKRKNANINTFNAEVNFSAQSFLDTKIYYFYSDRHLPGNITLYDDWANERLYDENFFVQSKFNHKLKEQFDVQGLIKYNHSWNRYFDGKESVESSKVMHNYVYRQNEVYASFGVSYKVKSLQDKLQFSLVGDELWNTLKTNIPEYDSKYRNTTYITLRSKFTNDKIQVNASLVYTHLNESNAQYSFDPNVSLSYKMLSQKDLFLRASWRKAFRLPTFNDMYYYRIGNHDLRPEKTDEINFGFTYSDKYSFGEVSFTADVFYNRVKDMIVAIPTTFAWKMSNYGKVRIKGVNLNAEYHHKSLFLSVGYNYNDVRNVTNKESDYYNSQVPYTSKHSGNAALIWKNSYVDFGYSMDWMGERYSSLMHDKRYKLNAYVDQSLTLSHCFNFRKFAIETTLSCRNIFDQQYEIIKFYPMPGRQIEIQTKIILNK